MESLWSANDYPASLSRPAMPASSPPRAELQSLVLGRVVGLVAADGRPLPGASYLGFGGGFTTGSGVVPDSVKSNSPIAAE